MLDLVPPSFARFVIAMKFGIAIAARMPMITTTIISSIKVKPFSARGMTLAPLGGWWATPRPDVHGRVKFTQPTCPPRHATGPACATSTCAFGRPGRQPSGAALRPDPLASRPIRPDPGALALGPVASPDRVPAPERDNEDGIPPVLA